MERRLHTDDFEELLKQKSDQYKMYPSEKVWKEINRTLHPRRKWYWFGFALLLSGVGYYSVSELTSPVESAHIAKSTIKNTSGIPAPKPAELVPFKAAARPGKKAEESEPNTMGADLAGQLIASNQQSDISNGDVAVPGKVVSMQGYIRNLEGQNLTFQFDSDELADHKAIPSRDLIENLLSKLDPLSPPRDEDKAQPETQSDFVQEKQARPSVNWLHEYAAYELAIPRTKRLSWQLFISPTMNYRKLTGSNNAHLESAVKNVPLALNIQGELNGLVNHKPALGFEFGSALLYAVNKNVSVKLGVQFNYSRYSIQAFQTPTEIGTIALSANNTFSRDSIRTYTQVSNFGGISEKDMQNQYFQFSAPVGIEWRLLGNGRLQLNVAGSVQPTYLLNRNSYLITTDYKNYIQEPSLVRRWNVNTSAEAYLSYKTGGVRWQLGPQFRYQLLSSYANEYPIKEYLMEYGVKIGVTKTIR